MTTLAETALPSPWRGHHGRTTVGVFSLAFLFAFEALAVSTVMPEIAADLDGLRWYAVAFAGPLAASVVALTNAGPAADRLGPGPVLRCGLVIFCIGAAIAGVATSMPLFILGRLVHGYGGGVLGVALYVVIAQAYPEQMRPRMFAILTMAWVLPALVGPLLAAQVAAALGWRWIFLGAPVLAIVSWLLVAGAPSKPGVDKAAPGRLKWALVAAAGTLCISLAGQQVVRWWALLVLVGVVAVVVGGRALLPADSWSLRPGLPVVLGSRAAIGTAVAAAEVYVPLLLVLERGLSLSQAGWVLTVGAVTWCVGAFLAARWSVLADEAGRVRLGAVLVAVGIGVFATVAVPGLPVVIPVAAWGVAGLGIGMAFSTLSVLALATATAGEEGRTSSALQLNDQLAMATAIALSGVLFASLADTAPTAAATGLVLAAATLAVVALLPAARLIRVDAPSST